MTRPEPPRRVPWRSVGSALVAVGVGLGVAVWIARVGGPEAFRDRFGLAAVAVSLPAHVLTALTPVGEILPFGAANGAVYGLWRGAGLNWLAWMVAAVLQYAFGRSARREMGTAPRWLRRLPVQSALVLTVGRWPPGGSVFVDAAAGAAGVPLRRVLLFAAIGHAPQAVAVAAVGAGLLRLL